MKPAMLGGRPAFSKPLPLARPYLGRIDRITQRIGELLKTGMLTDGIWTRALEQSVSGRINGECVAVSSCTTGLILLFKALDLQGEVILPSFTFFASGHALLWNGLKPVFADCDPETFTLDPASAAKRLTRRTAAILAVNVFGNPPDMPGLLRLARRAGVPLLLDGAQGMGSRSQGRLAGTEGLATVFSLTPSKPVAAGEGGLVVTADRALAQRVRILRNYGNDGAYNPSLLGLNGRMSELHATVALESLRALDEHLAKRRKIAGRYRRHLAGVPGISFQTVRAGDESTFKDFAIKVGPDFGLSRNGLVETLHRENIQTRSYFDPPLHRQTLYRSLRPRLPLTHTERLSREVLCLPIFGAITPIEVDRVCETIALIQQRAAAAQRAAPVGPVRLR